MTAVNFSSDKSQRYASDSTSNCGITVSQKYSLFELNFGHEQKKKLWYETWP